MDHVITTSVTCSYCHALIFATHFKTYHNGGKIDIHNDLE